MSYDETPRPAEPSAAPSASDNKQRKLIQKMIKSRRYKAIIKMVGERRMLVGFERNNKRSRKSRIKFITKPIDLATMNPIELVAPEPNRPEVTDEQPKPEANETAAS